MVTSEFVLLFLDIINIGGCFCYADLKVRKVIGQKVKRVWPAQWSGLPVMYI